MLNGLNHRYNTSDLCFICHWSMEYALQKNSKQDPDDDLYNSVEMSIQINKMLFKVTVLLYFIKILAGSITNAHCMFLITVSVSGHPKGKGEGLTSNFPLCKMYGCFLE